MWVQPSGEVGQRGVSAAAAAFLDDGAGRRLADRLDAGEPVADSGRNAGRAAELDAEDGLGGIDAGRQQADAETPKLLAEAVELVAVGQIERHRRGEELQRIVGLEVSR